MSSTPEKPKIEDWVILKYGWLFVFLVHIVFLGAGVREMRAAQELFSPELLDTAQLRLDHVFQAIYMWTIAFSILLLIVAVFILEIFRNQKRILERLAALDTGMRDQTDGRAFTGREPGSESPRGG